MIRRGLVGAYPGLLAAALGGLLAAALGCSGPAPAPAVPDVHAELAALDGRTPVPLVPQMAAHQREQMRDHLVVLQEVTRALASDDLDAAARAATRLGTSDSMTATCTHMGAGAPGFTERALEMHRRADGIAEAARLGDHEGTLGALAETLAACTSCHAAYRQELVDQVSWPARAGGSAPHR